MDNRERGRRDTRAASLRAEIVRLQRIEDLLPTTDDFLKYGMTTEEVEAIDFHPGTSIGDLIRIRNGVNCGMVVLRKRDAERPQEPITVGELRGTIVVFIDDDRGGYMASFAVNKLSAYGLIEYVDRPHMTVIIKPKM